METRRARRVPYSRQVFLNCPFDDDYRPLLRAAIFAVQACGFTARDAAGLDPRAHDDKPEKLIACVRDFLSAGLDPKPIGPTAMIALYDRFVSALPGPPPCLGQTPVVK
jgi:hypothetical protein